MTSVNRVNISRIETPYMSTQTLKPSELNTLMPGDIISAKMHPDVFMFNGTYIVNKKPEVSEDGGIKLNLTEVAPDYVSDCSTIIHPDGKEGTVNLVGHLDVYA